jgi:hypothetical protein
MLAMCAMAGCAGNQLASTPPPGVDLSGRWTLNLADSDDAQRLMQSQIAAQTAGVDAGGSSGGGGGRQRGRGGIPGGPMGPTGPSMPSVAVLDESLRWPGRDLSLEQTPDRISFTTDGAVRSCHPTARHGGGGHHPPAHGADASGAASPRGRDMPSHGRGDAPPPRCGWDEHSLVVQSGEPDDDRPPYEQRFSLSDDGQRLVEVVVFKGGRSNGFVASREWDRAAAGAASTPAGPGPGGAPRSGPPGATPAEAVPRQ